MNVEKRAFIIVNPHAGRGRAAGLAGPLPATAKNLGWTVESHTTRYAGEEKDLAARARAMGWPVVLAVGGDGTVHGVANGLLSDGPTEVILAHVPIGTGNDFAKILSLEKSRDPKRNLELALSGTIHRLDVGRALGEYFVNGLGVGFGAEVVRRSREFKRLKGFALYVAAVYRSFFGFEAPELEVAAEEYREQGRLLMVEVSIGKTAGGGFRLTPEADPSDGMFDVCLIREVSPLTFLRYVPQVMRGTHGQLEPVTIFRTRQARIRCQDTPPLAVHLDGELRTAEGGEVVCDILPRHIAALCAS
ncbi:MAG: diacylglycerol/lipid kinase family protein [Gemmatimonadales bacterium]